MSDLGRWTDQLVRELALDVPVDLALILEVAKDAAHSVTRPAAPVTTYLLGVVAGVAHAAGADPDEAARVAAGRVRALADAWSERPE